MKKFLSLLTMLLLTVVVVSSCSKDDDPSDNDLFVGTYKGSVSFSGEGDPIRSDNGSIVVTKLSGDTYNFNFSDNIPSLNGIKMKKGDNSTISLSDDSFGTLRITAGKLTMLYIKDGKTWTANASR